MWVPAKKDVRKAAKDNRKSTGASHGNNKNSFAPLSNDDMEVGDVNEDEVEAVFVRQEC